MGEETGESLPFPPHTSRGVFWAGVSSTAGVFITLSVGHLLLRTPTDKLVTDAGLLSVLGCEAAMALVWVPYLRRRGWTMREITHPASYGDIALGASLAALSLVSYWLLFLVTAAVAPGVARAAGDMRIGGDLSPWVVLLISLANPVAEEFLYLGFVANVLRKQDVLWALSASVAVRILVHLYQGPVGLLANLPFGAILAAYYLTNGRLWPAVFAHGLLDLLAFSELVRG